MKKKMASFSWVNPSLTSSEPENFILPEKHRPDLSYASQLSSVPIIDMNQEDHWVVQNLDGACREFGFFQVINHGVSPELCRRMLDATAEFFLQSSEEKAAYFSEDPVAKVRVLNRYLKVEEEGEKKKKKRASMWSEVLFHTWHPTLDFTEPLPKNPPQYREVIREYAKEIEELMRRLLSLLSQGLGLDKDYLEKRVGENPRYKAQANYYPPCPYPELTLGLAAHTDPNLITLLLQSDGVVGLQIIKDDQWVSVHPVPNSFVVNLGDQMQVLTNKRYKSVVHRAVTNKNRPRVSHAMFHGPHEDTIIGPIEELIDEEHPQVYRSYRYGEFIREFNRQEGNRRGIKEAFELHI